ncbi:MAG: capsular biosynthesis protein [Bacilli bacterium]|nr:capsular biosynthesis protein [Bacilli bacterium]
MNSMIFDIDGTICPIKKKNENYEDLIPYEKMIKKIKELKELGFRIILYTSRNMRTYEGDLEKINNYTKPVLVRWLEKWDIPYDELLIGKPWPGPVGFYIDDKAIRPNELINFDLESLYSICENSKVGIDL